MDNASPKVTIITIVRNGVATLERTIRSVLEQTYSNIEYIVVDGGSEDGSLDIIKRYEDHLVWESESDRGISHAFNKGIGQATGDWVGLLNADDWYELDAVEQVIENIRNAKADVVHGAVRMWQGEASTEVIYPNQRQLARQMTINHPTAFVRKSVYDRFGLYKETYKIGMDYELLLRLWQNRCVFLELDAVLANMSLGGISDLQWKIASQEWMQAQIENGDRAFKARFLHALRIGRGNGRRALQKAGLDALVVFYRKNYSVMKKENVQN